MISLKTAASAAAFTMLMGAGALVATTGGASARVVCNDSGDCWHTDSDATYPGTGYTNHPDDWYFHQTWNDNSRYHYRDYHEGHGYYRSGLWITL
jgi:hypothetical protein